MRIGVDLDGCLANFESAAVPRIVEVTGRDLFPHQFVKQCGEYGPPVWEWPDYYGYTKEEMTAVWGAITADNTFWLTLDELDGMRTLRLLWPTLAAHEVYFITNRPGIRAKHQSELWLFSHFLHAIWTQREAVTQMQREAWPTVLISAEKGKVASALRLDAYLDDKVENIQDVHREAWETRPFLLTRAYNTYWTDMPEEVVRVASVGAFFDQLQLT